MSDVLRCMDCGKPYADFPLDVVLPRGQWLAIHPDENGVLCAACIVERAARVPGATVVHAIIEVAPMSKVVTMLAAIALSCGCAFLPYSAPPSARPEQIGGLAGLFVNVKGGDASEVPTMGPVDADARLPSEQHSLSVVAPAPVPSTGSLSTPDDRRTSAPLPSRPGAKRNLPASGSRPEVAQSPAGGRVVDADELRAKGPASVSAAPPQAAGKPESSQEDSVVVPAEPTVAPEPTPTSGAITTNTPPAAVATESIPEPTPAEEIGDRMSFTAIIISIFAMLFALAAWVRSDGAATLAKVAREKAHEALSYVERNTPKQGPQGERGLTGDAGVSIRGAVGPAGPAGRPGKDAEPSARGLRGRVGPEGRRGLRGYAGKVIEVLRGKKKR